MQNDYEMCDDSFRQPMIRESCLLGNKATAVTVSVKKVFARNYDIMHGALAHPFKSEGQGSSSLQTSVTD